MIFTLTRDQLEAKRQTLADNGFTLTGDSGTASFRNYEASYAYDGHTLTVEITKSPFPAVAMKIIGEKKVQQWMG